MHIVTGGIFVRWCLQTDESSSVWMFFFFATWLKKTWLRFACAAFLHSFPVKHTTPSGGRSLVFLGGAVHAIVNIALIHWFCDVCCTFVGFCLMRDGFVLPESCSELLWDASLLAGWCPLIYFFALSEKDHPSWSMALNHQLGRVLFASPPRPRYSDDDTWQQLVDLWNEMQVDWVWYWRLQMIYEILNST